MSRTPDWMDCHRTPEDALRGVAFYAPRFPAVALRCPPTMPQGANGAGAGYAVVIPETAARLEAQGWTRVEGEG